MFGLHGCQAGEPPNTCTAPSQGAARGPRPAARSLQLCSECASHPHLSASPVLGAAGGRGLGHPAWLPPGRLAASLTLLGPTPSSAPLCSPTALCSVLPCLAPPPPAQRRHQQHGACTAGGGQRDPALMASCSSALLDGHPSVPAPRTHLVPLAAPNRHQQQGRGPAGGGEREPEPGCAGRPASSAPGAAGSLESRQQLLGLLAKAETHRPPLCLVQCCREQ